MARVGRSGVGTPGATRRSLSTGVKILSIITLALLPLGVIALFASLQATRTADLERRADLRVAATESTRKLGTELASDIAVLKEATATIADGGNAGDACARAAAKLGARVSRSPQFALFGVASTPVCATRGYRPLRPGTAIAAKPTARITSDAIDVTVPRNTGSAVAVAHYPAATLALFARPVGFSGPYAIELADAIDAIVVTNGLVVPVFNRESVTAPVDLLDLVLTFTAEGVTFGATDALLTFLPLLMWASAAAIGFFVVDRLLIRPLKSLRAAVGSYVPGTQFRFIGDRTPAVEIRELGTSFADFANKLARREAELAEALAVQTKLTREVHHRVKNNLQVIASLISLHARGAPTPEATMAYAAIQRRVDALAIVHRNHYAGFDESEGIHLRTLISELATNLRANPVGATPPAITIAAPSLFAGQDSAIPIAFLVTELAELSMTNDHVAAIRIEISEKASGVGKLVITSAGLIEPGHARYIRIVAALARQLRAPLDHDTAMGSYCVDFPVLPKKVD